MEQLTKNKFMTLVIGLVAGVCAYKITTQLLERPEEDETPPCEQENFEWAAEIIQKHQQENLMIDLTQYPHLQQLLN
jgi:hypothetical protein